MPMFCRICHAPRQRDISGCGQLCRIIAPHVPPFARQAYTAEAPPKSIGGREEVSLSPACVIAPGLPQPGLRVPLIARAYSRRCVGPFSLAFYSHAGNVPETPYMKFSRFPEGFSPSHFLFAEFFCEIPTLFQKNFLCRFQKTKKRPLHLFSRRSERKK